MKPNNAMKTCGYWAPVEKYKLKHDVQTQVPDALQAMFVFYNTQLDAIPQY